MAERAASGSVNRRDHVLSGMRSREIRRIPVVDDENNLVGIVALGDLAVDEVPGPKVPLEQISKPARPDL